VNRTGKRACDLIRDLIFENPNRSLDDIARELERSGLTTNKNSIASTRSGFIGALMFLADAGVYSAPCLAARKSRHRRQRKSELSFEGIKRAALRQMNRY
jgi:hypothetical protein